MVSSTSRGFPQCAGTVDGTHCHYVAYDFPVDYFSCKGWHSILMQGIIDHLPDLLTFTLDGPEECMTQVFR